MVWQAWSVFFGCENEINCHVRKVLYNKIMQCMQTCRLVISNKKRRQRQIKEVSGIVYDKIPIQVGYGICDLGVTIISYKIDRARFIDYTFPVGEDGINWISLPPKNLPSFTNIIWLFDAVSWSCIFISLVLVTTTLFIIAWYKLYNPIHFDIV